jgi:hypothetical protein
MDPRSLIWSAIERSVRAHGFKPQRKANAFLVRPETTCVLNLQKSQWGEQFSVNCGVWLNRFGKQEQPKEYTCQIRWRLTSLVEGESQKAVTEALDLERPFDEAARLATISDAVDRFGVSLLLRCDSERHAVAMLSGFPPRAFLAIKELNPQGLKA